MIEQQIEITDTENGSQYIVTYKGEEHGLTDLLNLLNDTDHIVAGIYSGEM